MHPLFEQTGMTPTASVAYRAKAQEARQAFAAKAREKLDANGIPASKDAYETAITEKRNASKLDADGNVVEVTFNWDPDNKVLTKEESGEIVATPTEQFNP
jgi:predicted metal-dependent HD superfamily phosphohydrolase